MLGRRSVFCLGLFLTIFHVGAAVLHIQPTASGPETNGLSWATAFNSVTQALLQASSGDELWIAAGTYKGTLQVPAGVLLYGGFAGTEANRTQRNWERNRSVIDGDQTSDEYPSDYIKPQRAVTLGTGSRLDGFTVLNGLFSYGSAVYAGEPGAIVGNNIIVTNGTTGIFNGAVLVDRLGQFDPAEDFFLKTANDLLLQQFGFGATNIPVAYYGPAVHRLLQVAANIYDASRSNIFPSVFRPQFVTTPGGVIISGYYRDETADTVDDWLSANPYGIPMIIGARKCIPDFNEYSAQTAVLAARKLELRRLDTNSPPYQTNEMYIVGISNFFGLEAWNSCTQVFAGPLEMRVMNNVTVALTNSDGLNFVKQERFSTSNMLSTWQGFADPRNPERPVSRASFKVPLYTNTITLSNSVYRFTPTPRLDHISTTNSFTVNSGFRNPDWQLSISNNLVYVLSITNRILDFVHLPHLTNNVNLSRDLLGNSHIVQGEGIIAQCWSTNRPGASPTIFTPTAGIQAQIDISLGNPTISPTQWKEFSFDTQDKDAAIDGFRQFVFPGWYGGNTNLIQQAPFTPTRKIVVTASWEANDPLVHHLEAHLKGITNNYALTFFRPFTGEMATNHTLGRINGRYSPWRGHPSQQPRPEDTNPTLKDPTVTKSDDFDLPSGPDVNLHWLDRVHRGTPWQTLYFDRAVATPQQWVRQSLDPMSHPTNDWKVIEYLRSRLDYSQPAAAARALNNTIVGNSAGGVFVVTNANAVVMNNAIAYNFWELMSEGSASAEFSHNYISGSPQFVSGDFSVLASSPLVDAGDNAALAWIERTVLGARTDIGAFEFGPDGIPVLTMNRSPESGGELQLQGYPGQSYVIEASTNLVHWTSISTNIAEMGTLLFRDAQSTNFSHRFYRATIAD